jgi:AbrB family looped-hinge helix DNA binding protein
MSVKVSSKYQVVIPEAIRTALGLKPGTQVDVIAKGGIAYIVPLKPMTDIQKTLAKALDAKDVGKVRDKKDRF